MPTDGSGYHPYVESSSTLDVFDMMWCRSIQLTPSRTAATATSTNSSGNSIADDIDVDVFVQSDDVYDNEDFERGFCVSDDMQCMDRGVLDVAPCRGEWSSSFEESDVS